MEAIKDRMKKLAITIMVGPADDSEKEEMDEKETDDKLKEEGLAPSLAKVDEEGGEDLAGMLVNGEERKIEQKIAKGEKPLSFGERVAMEAQKKRVTDRK
jgi:hypothetical protein